MTLLTEKHSHRKNRYYLINKDQQVQTITLQKASMKTKSKKESFCLNVHILESHFMLIFIYLASHTSTQFNFILQFLISQLAQKLSD